MVEKASQTIQKNPWTQTDKQNQMAQRNRKPNLALMPAGPQHLPLRPASQVLRIHRIKTNISTFAVLKYFLKPKLIL